jgi:hypothetical protein
LTSLFTGAIKEMDLIKLNNAGMIAEKLSDMDSSLKRIGERKLSQLQFGDLKNKFITKYEIY